MILKYSMSSGLVKVRRNSMYFLMMIDPTEDFRKKYRKRKIYIYIHIILFLDKLINSTPNYRTQKTKHINVTK